MMEYYENLTRKEKIVIDLFLDGNLTSKEIANKLDITITTVNKTFERVKDKFGFYSKSHLFQIMMQERNRILKQNINLILSQL